MLMEIERALGPFAVAQTQLCSTWIAVRSLNYESYWNCFGAYEDGCRLQEQVKVEVHPERSTEYKNTAQPLVSGQ